jgi:hypothetical protein
MCCLFAICALPSVAIASNDNYESDVKTATGEVGEIEVDVQGTTALSYKVFVNGDLVQEGPVSGQGTFTIDLDEAVEDGNVVVKGRTSGQSGPYEAEITLILN